ncbi:Rieske 2Fe-2S domain-containing protein [Hyphobacterium sp.]|uniref:Rieske 2Fe-2S domain-containing protein n=1 Tax=Hyphobacterium sp. TaxID=2004662 RepID=UPI003B52696C
MAKDTALDDVFLRDLWYFGIVGKEIKPGEMIQKERLGELILFGRTHDGEAFAMTDICPHRAILLSGGRMVKGESGTEVQCPYHGWRFRPDGQCASIPSLTADQAEAMDIAKIRAKTYRVHESYGIVWIWFGYDEAAEPCLPPPTLDIPEDSEVRMFDACDFHCDMDAAVISLMDPAHIPYIHNQSWWRTPETMHEKQKTFGPIERGFSMLPHKPSSNSFIYKLFGTGITTEIQLELPGLRPEYMKAGDKHVTTVTIVTPVSANKTIISIILYWNHGLVSLVPKWLIRRAIRVFMKQDSTAVDSQAIGLSYDPPQMFIHDSDIPAKWYLALRRNWEKHRLEGADFVNPLKENKTLRWRS